MIITKTVLDRVLFWTQGQSCLTQTLFKLVADNSDKIIAGKEVEQVDYLIRTKVLKNWRNQSTGQYLQTLEQRLLDNQQVEPTRLLRLYRLMLTTKVFIDDSQEQQELIKTGLVVRQQDRLAIANRIYKSVFDFTWVEKKLAEVKNNEKLQLAVIPLKTSTKVPIVEKEEKKRFLLKNLLLLLALLALILVFFNNVSKSLKVRTAFKQGNRFLKQKSFAKAIAEYNSLLNIDSNYFQAWD